MASEGLHYLNAFPSAKQFVRVGIGYQDAEIDADELNFSSTAKNDKNLITRLIYGRVLDQHSFFSVELPYIYSEENSIRYGDQSNQTFQSQGLREPTLSYKRRLRHKVSDGNYYTDLKLSYTPALFDKKVGGHDANKVSGRHVGNILVTTGARYDFYEALIGAQFTYNSSAREDNLKSDIDYTFTAYFSTKVYLKLQKRYKKDWFFYLSSGFTYTDDYDVDGINELVTIQQGTGAMGELGSKYLVYSGFIELNLNYVRNDYFTTSDSQGNFRGNFYQFGTRLSYTREF